MDRRERRSILLDERAVPGAPRQRLDPERAAPGVEVGDDGIDEDVEAGQRVEDRLAHPIGGRSRGRGRGATSLRPRNSPATIRIAAG